MLTRRFKAFLGGKLVAQKGLQTKLLKISTYPRFVEWQERHSVENPVDGRPREKRNKLFGVVARNQMLSDAPITYLEFGVHEGESLFWWAAENSAPDSRFFGFDSFEGLPENWGRDRLAGTFSTNGQVPESSDPRIRFVKGWFHQTLHSTLPEIDFNRVLVIHMDADLYRSSIFPLMVIGPMLKRGDVLIFDEFSDSVHEFRAFEECVAIFRWDYEVLAASTGNEQVALKIC